MIKITTPLIRTAAVAAFVGSLAIAAPLHAQSTINAQSTTTTPAVEGNTPMDQPQVDQTTSPPASTTSTAPTDKHSEARVEQRIKTLRAKLKITPAEEGDWKAVAETMRENESKINELVEARRQSPDDMTAVDDIESYRQITQAHADGLQSMVTAFRTLYNDMSDAQKKNADQVFGSFEHRGKHAK